MQMEPFDYNKAMAELEQTAALVEDPSTPIDELDKLITRSQELIEQCRAYLRSAREKADILGK